MTAISAAIVELEAWREKLSRLISDLRLHDRAIELSYPAQSDVVAAAPAHSAAPVTDAHHKPRTPRRPAPKSARRQAGTERAIPKSTPPPAKSVPQVQRGGRKRGDTMERIYQAIVGGAKTTDRIVAVSGVPKGGLHANLQRLLEAKRIISTKGNGRMLLYSATATARPPKTDDGLEVAWNGTKERNGQAPTLSGARIAN